MKKTRETRVRRERALSGVSLPGSQHSGCPHVDTPLASGCPLDLFSLRELKTKAFHKLNQTTLHKILLLGRKTVCCTVRDASPSFHFNTETRVIQVPSVFMGGGLFILMDSF